MNASREQDQTARFFFVWVLGIAFVALILFIAWHFMLPRRIGAIGHVIKHGPAAGEPQQAKTRWGIDVEIPMEDVEFVRAAHVGDNGGDLDVDLLLTSTPTTMFRGKLARDKIKPGARPGTCAGTVRIDPVDGDIADDVRVPDDLLVANTEVHVRIRCR